MYPPKLFNTKKFTIKKKINSTELKALLGKNYKHTKVNLDIDFSVSKGGYRLRPHRDDITRLYNFLIYLTDIPRKNGGSLTIYKKKSKKNIRKSFKRFPKMSELEIVKSFTPKKGTVVFFNQLQIHIMELNVLSKRTVLKGFLFMEVMHKIPLLYWKYKDATYYPHIIYSKKECLPLSMMQTI